MFRPWWVALGALALCATAPAVELTHDGQPRAVIVIADNATAADQFAARELADHVEQISGAKLTFRKESEPSDENLPRILIGRTKQTVLLAPDVQWDSLGHDGIIIRTAGKALILSGGTPRGRSTRLIPSLKTRSACAGGRATRVSFQKRRRFRLEN